MVMNVYDLAQTDTSLKRVSYQEYAGQCPGCGGSDRFHVQPYRRKGGAWMCRNCWPAESKGWGDGISYLRQFRGMSFKQAKAYLSGEIDSLLETVYNAQEMYEQTRLPDNEHLQERYQDYIRLAITRLWTPQGKPCLDYLLSRGLSEDTIREARLGAIDSATLRREYLGKVEADTQFIVIPWYADNLLWGVQLRDIRPDAPQNERYRKFPKSGNGLYLADSLKRKLPTFLVEGELDALSIFQAAGDIVNPVATGGKDGSLTSTWVTRLARVPLVLVAFDREAEAEQRANAWLKILSHNAMRYKPQLKDVNKMLVEGRNVRRWVLAILDYLSSEDQDAQSVQAAPSTQNGEPGQEPTFCCSECESDLTDNERACYNQEGLAFCDYDENGVAFCSRGRDRTEQPETYEQSISIAHTFAAVLGPDCKVTPVEPGYTLEQHIAHLQEQSAEPTELEQAIMSRLQCHDVFMGDTCSCGCRLKWKSAGAIVCAHCEPGGLWSNQALEMLKQAA